MIALDFSHSTTALANRTLSATEEATVFYILLAIMGKHRGKHRGKDGVDSAEVNQQNIRHDSKLSYGCTLLR